MTSATYAQWLAGAALRSYAGNTLSIRVTTTYAVDWLTARWKTVIERLFRDISDVPNLEVEFVAE